MKTRFSNIKHYYELEMKIDISVISDSAKKLVDNINSTMNSFGFTEKMFIMSGPIKLQITSGEKLTLEEQNKIVVLWSDAMKKTCPDYKIMLSPLKYLGINT